MLQSRGPAHPTLSRLGTAAEAAAARGGPEPGLEDLAHCAPGGWQRIRGCWGLAVLVTCARGLGVWTSAGRSSSLQSGGSQARHSSRTKWGGEAEDLGEPPGARSPRQLLTGPWGWPLPNKELKAWRPFAGRPHARGGFGQKPRSLADGIALWAHGGSLRSPGPAFDPENRTGTCRLHHQPGGSAPSVG